MTLRSRNTSRESAFISSDERTSCNYSNREPGASRKEKSSVGNGVRDGKNRRKIGKKKQHKRKRRQRAFKDTIVLAPFHALKLGFQNKLKDMYNKGLLESNTKRVKIPNNSLFRYDVMEMRTNESDAEEHEAEKVESTSKNMNFDQSDQSEYCHCFRKVDAGTNPELPSTSSAGPTAEQMESSTPAKQMRTEISSELLRTDEGRKRGRSSRDTNRSLPSRDDTVQRSKTQPGKTADKRPKKRHNIRYNTRSVTRRVTQQGDENAEDRKQKDKDKQVDPQSSKTSSEQKDRQKTDEIRTEEATFQDRNLMSMRSNSSVIFLEEITNAKVETEEKPERSAEESIAVISAVTQMFDTLLKSSGEDGARKFRSGSGSRKLTPRSCSSERRPEEDPERCNQRAIEANVVIHEANQDSSSSERISEDCRTIESSGLTPSSSSKPFAPRPDKTTAYIFGPKCPFQEFRESCEFGFGMSRDFSDDEADDCSSGGNVDFKKHR